MFMGGQKSCVCIVTPDQGTINAIQTGAGHYTDKQLIGAIQN